VQLANVDHRQVIRNICIHLANEQPLLADMFDLPSASDAGLLCTNVRSLDGKRPVFIDSMTATFFFPYHIVRFLEIPEGAVDPRRFDDAQGGQGDAADGSWAAGLDPQNRLPVVVGSAGDEDVGLELEIDEEFLQRIRDI
jgi:hypothetical protein